MLRGGGPNGVAAFEMRYDFGRRRLEKFGESAKNVGLAEARLQGRRFEVVAV